MFKDFKELIGSYIFSKNNKLFINKQELFNKEIIIFDLEYNGHGSKCDNTMTELLEFCGIKIHKGKIVNAIEFKCRHKKHEMHEKTKEKVPYKYNVKEYSEREKIDYYFPDLKEFILKNNNCVFYSWDNCNDVWVLEKVFLDFNVDISSLKAQFKDIEPIVDYKNNILKKKSLSETYSDFIQERKSKFFKIDKHTIGVKEHINKNCHLAISDVLKIIYLIKVSEIDFNDMANL